MEIVDFQITKNISIKGFSLIRSNNDRLLFFVHGLASNSTLFLPLANKLFKLGYSSISLDTTSIIINIPLFSEIAPKYNISISFCIFL